VLANPTLKFTGDIRATRLYPSPLPDLFKGEQLVLVGRYTGKGDSAVIIEGDVNGTPRKFSYDVKFTEDSSENDFIPRLWATRRVGYLLDEIRLRGENSELKDEATELARKYGIVTPYTAYLIMEDERQRNIPEPVRLMPHFERDREARQEAARAWNSLQENKSGGAAVADAQSGMALRSATAPTAATAESLSRFKGRYGLAGAAPGAQTPTTLPPQTSSPVPAQAPTTEARVIQYSQQSKFVAGKTFFQNEKGWIDSAIQKMPDAKHVRLQFGSQEYFDFMKKHPEAAPWLALGQNVQFELDKIIYEVVE
jgi:Ca-activated chloride channel family protein